MPGPDERIVACPSDSFPIGTEEFWVRNRLSGAVYDIDRPLAEVMHAAGELTEPAIVAERLLAMGWPDAAAAAGAIAELKSRKLVLSESDLFGLLSNVRSDSSELRRGTADDDGAVRRIYVTSHNRLEQVTTAVTSFCNGEGEGAPVVVVDDTPDPDAVEVRRRTEAVGASIVQLDEKRRLIEEIVSLCGADLRQTVEFAVLGAPELGTTTGAQRNCALLHGAGSVFLCCDDDTSRMGIPGDGRTAVTITSERDACPARFYPDSLACREGVSPSRIPIEQRHGNILGRRIASLGEAVSFGALRGEDTPLLSGGRIVATTSGIWGDSGMRRPFSHLFLDGRTHDAILCDDAQYWYARSSRYLLILPPVAIVGPSLRFVTPHMGIDARTIVPPFFPVGRNSDGLFASMLRWCVPGALLAYADYAVAHFPTPERRYGDEVLSAVDAELPELFGALVASCTQPVATASAESAFAAVGRNLLAACDRSPGDFQDLIGGLWARTISAYVEEALSTYESPRVEGCGGPDDDRYDSDLRQHLSSLRESLLAESTAVPADIFARLDDSPNRSERAVAAFQDLVRQYGVLLCNWPRVFQAAVQVAEGGG